MITLQLAVLKTTEMHFLVINEYYRTKNVISVTFKQMIKIKKFVKLKNIVRTKMYLL